MITQQLPVDFPEIQGAIYRVALSLDALLVHGIQQGVLQRDVFPGFLERTERNLWRDVAGMEEQAAHVAGVRDLAIASTLTALKARFQQLLDLVNGLSSFTHLTLPQLRATVSQIPLLRGECVRLIQELEACCRVPQPFYPTRPSHATASVDQALANLEQTFVAAWAAANTGRPENGTSNSLASASNLHSEFPT